MMYSTLYRTRKHTFRQGFFNADGVTPLQPLNSDYPAYAIYDTAGTEIETGIAVADPTAGYYVVDFTPDASANLSTNVLHWRIEWLMVTNDNRQIQYKEVFDVEDEWTDEARSRALSLLGLSGKPLDVYLRLPNSVADVSVDIYQGTSESSSVFSAAKSTGNISERQIDNMYMYSATVGSGVFTANPLSKYMAVWQITDPSITTQQFVTSQILIVNLKIMSWLNPLRLLIDKVQKKVNQIQSYEDADLVTFFDQGLGFMNLWYPLTSYTLASVPTALEPFLVICAAYWGLLAQFGLETDLQHSFSGQTISLEYDRTGNIADQLNRFKEWLTENLTKAKVALNRRANVGVLGAAYPWSGRQMILPLGSSGGSQSGSAGDVLSSDAFYSVSIALQGNVSPSGSFN